MKWIFAVGLFGSLTAGACGVLAGCATGRQPETAGLERTDSSVTITLEPSAQKGGVSAIYVKVKNQGTHLLAFTQPDVFYAIDPTGAVIASIDPETAVTAAGGERQLTGGLRHVASSQFANEMKPVHDILPWTPEFHQLVCDPGGAHYEWTLCHGGGWVMFPFLIFVGGGAGLVGGVASAALPDDANYHRRLEAAAFDYDQGLLAPGYDRTGYVFFPKGEYRAFGLNLKDEVTQQLVTATAPWR
jgi:hypothetical protein